MPQLITVGNTMYRINIRENRLEFSKTNGILWVKLTSMGPRYGRLKDLLWFHSKLFALTDTGLWYSMNGGADWGRCGSGKVVESLVALQDGGKYLYGMSADGHFWFSINEGACWALKG